MIDDKKVCDADQPVPKAPGSAEEEGLQTIAKAAMGGLATPNEVPRDLDREPSFPATVDPGSDAVKREAEQTLGLPPTTAEKIEERLPQKQPDPPAPDETLPPPEQGRNARDPDDTPIPDNTLDAIIEHAGLGEGKRRGS